MKTFARFSLAAITLAAVLGSTACAAEVNTSGDDLARYKNTPASTTKVEGFTDKLDFVGAPDAWDGSAGWTTTTGPADKTVAVLGDNVAYVTGRQYASGSDWEVDKPGTLVVVDSKGSVVYESAALPEGRMLAGSTLRKLSKDGTDYFVYAENVKQSADETSVKKDTSDYKSSSVTVLNKDAKEVFKKPLADGEWAALGEIDDSIRINGGGKLMDVATGEIAPQPEKAGHKWSGRYDGVDIFRNLTTGATTNGEWSVADKAGSRYAASHVPDNFGNLIKVMTDGTYGECKVIDPHTGTELLDDAKPIACTIGKDALASPDGKLVLAAGGILNLADGKFFPITKDMDFSVKSISDNGDVYGLSSGSSDKRAGAYVNVLGADEPKRLPESAVAPSVVTASGLAIFPGEKNSPAGDMITSFIVKK